MSAEGAVMPAVELRLNDAVLHDDGEWYRVTGLLLREARPADMRVLFAGGGRLDCRVYDRIRVRSDGSQHDR